MKAYGGGSMKIVDKNLPPTLGPRGGKKPTLVSVVDRECMQKECYAPMIDKGPYVIGRGYTSYYANPAWVCRTRLLQGCPTT